MTLLQGSLLKPTELWKDHAADRSEEDSPPTLQSLRNYCLKKKRSSLNSKLGYLELGGNNMFMQKLSSQLAGILANKTLILILPEFSRAAGESKLQKWRQVSF